MIKALLWDALRRPIAQTSPNNHHASQEVHRSPKEASKMPQGAPSGFTPITHKVIKHEETQTKPKRKFKHMASEE